MSTKQVTDDQFEAEVIKGDGAILVDFWAEWCGPCKQLAPVLDEIATDMSDKLTIVKVNIDENPESPQKYNVRGIPTMILFKDGEPVATKVGSVPKSKIIEWLEESIAA